VALLSILLPQLEGQNFNQDKRMSGRSRIFPIRVESRQLVLILRFHTAGPAGKLGIEEDWADLYEITLNGTDKIKLSKVANFHAKCRQGSLSGGARVRW